MKIAALYARVSTGNQEKEATIESQISEVKERIKKDGNVLGDNLLFFDNGWSGDILARPSLDEMRDGARKKAFQILYVWDRDRIARRYSYQELVLDEIQELGIEFVDLQSAPIRNHEDKILMGFKGLFAEYERVKITERMRRGKLYKVKNHILFGWNAPFGYIYVKEEKNSSNTSPFKVIPNEADIVKRIFYWFVEEQLTIRQIIKRLYEQKIYPRKNKDGHWATSTLSRLLRDKTYIGTTFYNKKEAIKATNPRNKDGYKKIKKTSRKNRPVEEWYELSVPSIIDEKTYIRAQQQLKINSQFSMRNKVHEYLLSTLVRCTCGNTRAGEGVNGHLYYRCTDRVNRFPLPKECFAAGVNATILDSKTWNEIYKMVTSPEKIEKQYERWKIRVESIQKSPDFVDVPKLNKELKEQKDLEDRFVKAYGAKVISLEQLQSQLVDIRLKESQIKNKLSTSHNDSIPAQKSIILPDLKQFCDTMKAEIDGLNFTERQYVVRQLVDTVTTDGVTATVEGSIPLFISKENTQNYYEQRSLNRNRRTTERRKINIIQRLTQKTSS